MLYCFLCFMQCMHSLILKVLNYNVQCMQSGECLVATLAILLLVALPRRSSFSPSLVLA